MHDEFARQLIGELHASHKQAFAVLAAALGDVVGRAELTDALALRIKVAQAQNGDLFRDGLLASALESLVRCSTDPC
jgi:hypothetical protein